MDEAAELLERQAWVREELERARLDARVWREQLRRTLMSTPYQPEEDPNQKWAREADEQTAAREGFKAKRGQTEYRVAPAAVGSTTQQFTEVVEIPKSAKNVHFYKNRARLPQRYRHAVQHVR